MVKISLPKDVKTIIETIESAGYEAYAVGGCVRDSLLNRNPSDWDITTSAKPEEIKSLFKKTIDTGIQHGTVTVMIHHVGYEVTTYRIDGEYEDSRHPKNVIFTSNLIEDLKRRDFTINAMAYNDRCGIVDQFDGIRDLENKVIRAVGNPRERFSEDALRMMRAVRFSAQLGYEIEEETEKAISEMTANLENISAERIQVELVKLVTSPHPEKMRVLYRTGITRIILPEFDIAMNTQQNNPYHCYSVGEHIIESMIAAPADKNIRLAMLYHDMGKPQCRTTDSEGKDHFYGHSKISGEVCKNSLKQLKFDNDTIHTVSRLVIYHDYKILPERKYVRRAMNRIGKDIFPLLLQVKKADYLAKSTLKREEQEKNCSALSALYEEVLKYQECVDLKSLAVTGSDLISWGMKPGKELGNMLNALLERVLDNPKLNEKETLKELFLTLYTKK